MRNVRPFSYLLSAAEASDGSSHLKLGDQADFGTAGDRGSHREVATVPAHRFTTKARLKEVAVSRMLSTFCRIMLRAVSTPRQ